MWRENIVLEHEDVSSFIRQLFSGNTRISGWFATLKSNDVITCRRDGWLTTSWLLWNQTLAWHSNQNQTCSGTWRSSRCKWCRCRLRRSPSGGWCSAQQRPCWTSAERNTSMGQFAICVLSVFIILCLWQTKPRCRSSEPGCGSHGGPSRGRQRSSECHDPYHQTSRQIGRERWWWCTELRQETGRKNVIDQMVKTQTFLFELPENNKF